MGSKKFYMAKADVTVRSGWKEWCKEIVYLCNMREDQEVRCGAANPSIQAFSHVFKEEVYILHKSRNYTIV